MRVNGYTHLRASYPNTVILILQGYFYHAREDDAYILHAYLGYQLCDEKYPPLSRKKVGFPIWVLKKVLNMLDSFHFDYVVVRNYEIVEHQHFEDNTYPYFVSKIKESTFGRAAPQISHHFESGNRQAEDVVRHNCTVTIEYLDSQERFAFVLAPIQLEVKYQGMGGAYFGSFTYYAKDYVETDESATYVTEDSPLGRAVLGKRAGAVATFALPGRSCKTIQIISVEQGK